VFAPLVLLFVLVPLLELFVILQVGQLIGAWWTIAILIADSILGAVLMRTQGRAVWRRFQAAVAAGRPPAKEVVDGALVIFGGALLLTPGFTTDLVGLLLLLPPTRALARRVLVRRLVAGATLRFVAPRRPAAGPSSFDVDSTATDVEARRLP